MATVSNVTFPPPEDAGNGKLEVTVGYTIDFEPEELGKPHWVAVQLLGQDKLGDEEVPKPFQQPKVLYTFVEGLFPSKTITPTGPYSGTAHALVLREKLNEDPGYFVKEVAPGTIIEMPPADEVYARVTVSRVASGVSPAQTLFA